MKNIIFTIFIILISCKNDNQNQTKSNVFNDVFIGNKIKIYKDSLVFNFYITNESQDNYYLMNYWCFYGSITGHIDVHRNFMFNVNEILFEELPFSYLGNPLEITEVPMPELILIKARRQTHIKILYYGKYTKDFNTAKNLKLDFDFKFFNANDYNIFLKENTNKIINDDEIILEFKDTTQMDFKYMDYYFNDLIPDSLKTDKNFTDIFRSRVKRYFIRKEICN